MKKGQKHSEESKENIYRVLQAHDITMNVSQVLVSEIYKLNDPLVAQTFIKLAIAIRPNGGHCMIDDDWFREIMASTSERLKQYKGR